MKIVDVTLKMFLWDGFEPVVYGPNVRSSATSSEMGLVEISTDEGVSGYSFLGASYSSAKADAQRFIDVIRPLLIGENPLERERLHKRMWGRHRAATVRAISAADVALWDLAGRAANMPIHALLGTYRDSIPAYISSPAHSTPEGYRDEALSWKERGVTAYKLHVPSPWRRDIEACRAVRDAVGPGYVLMLDASWSYDYPTALKVGRALEELDFLWYEDPLGEWDIPSYVKLKQKLDIPLMATELPFAGLETYSVWLTAQATDYLRGGVAFKGGITNAIKTAHLAEAFGMNYEIHHGTNSINNVANLHVAMAIKNCDYLEVVVPEKNNKYGLVEDLKIDRDGHLHAPMKPGLGVEIDFSHIEKKKLALLR